MSNEVSAPAAPTEELDHTRGVEQKPFASVNVALVIYWLFCVAIGLLLLRDEIFSWNIPQAWGQAPLLLAYALGITLFNEWAYWQVTRNDGRQFNLPSTIIFTVFNGVLEVFAFMGFYKLLESGARAIFGADASIPLFIAGFLGFFIYSGLSHAFFWARALPRHFTADPAKQRLRKAMTPIQTLIVIGWCLYFAATRDLWTLVLLHLIIDVVLMVRVRPPLLTATTTNHNQPGVSGGIAQQ